MIQLFSLKQNEDAWKQKNIVLQDLRNFGVEHYVGTGISWRLGDIIFG